MFPREESVVVLNGWREQATEDVKLVRTSGRSVLCL